MMEVDHGRMLKTAMAALLLRLVLVPQFVYVLFVLSGGGYLPHPVVLIPSP